MKGAPSRGYGTPADRWAGMGPYYAMFPTAFSDAVVEKYSRPGDLVLDPLRDEARLLQRGEPGAEGVWDRDLPRGLGVRSHEA